MTKEDAGKQGKGIETEAKRAIYKHEPRRWIKPTNTKKYQPPQNKNNPTAACSPIRLFYSVITSNKPKNTYCKLCKID